MSQGSAIGGAELSRRFYEEAVEPVLRRRFPELTFSACLLGYGSEVLGLDDERSRDHNWGPRLRVLIGESDWSVRDRVSEALADELPVSFLGFPTNFENRGGAWQPTAIERGPVQHRVEFWLPGAFFEFYLGFDARRGTTTEDWLAIPTQRLLEVTAGPVFHDGLGVLERVRKELAWYPADVWRYVLACQWQRIAEEEAFVGRTDEVGDELGSRIILARLARDLVRLWLLVHRQYPPYSKWLGSAFTRSTPPAALVTSLDAALTAPRFADREQALAAAYEIVAQATNALGLASEVDPSPRLHGRPYLIIRGERFASALRESITDATLRERPLVGAIDQYVDSTAVLGDANVSRRATLRD
jgi:hypothetical protein